MYWQSSLRKLSSSILCACSWAKTQKGFPCCMLKLFTLKTHFMRASLGLMGWELSFWLGGSLMWWMGTEDGRCVFCSKDSCNERTETKDHCIAVGFPSLTGKCHLTFCWLQLAAVDVTVPIIRAFRVQQPPTCTTVRPQAFLEGAGGWEKWWHVLWFASVLHGLSARLGYVVSFVILIMCQEKKMKQRGVLLQCFEF